MVACPASSRSFSQSSRAPAGRSPCRASPASTPVRRGRPCRLSPRRLAPPGCSTCARSCRTRSIDLRYATPHNFTGVRLYPRDARCLIHKSMADGLPHRSEPVAARGCCAGVLGLLPTARGAGAHVPHRARPELGCPAGTVCLQPRGGAVGGRHACATARRHTVPVLPSRSRALPVRDGDAVRRLHRPGARVCNRHRSTRTCQPRAAAARHGRRRAARLLRRMVALRRAGSAVHRPILHVPVD